MSFLVKYFAIFMEIFNRLVSLHKPRCIAGIVEDFAPTRVEIPSI